MPKYLLAAPLLAIGLYYLPQPADSLFAQNPEEQDQAEEATDLAAELASIQGELKRAELDQRGLLQQQELDLLQASFEQDNATAALESYNVNDAQADKAEALLDLQYQRDSLADAEEELRQLGFMYDSNNLADATAQIVMQRAERDIERQQTALALAETAYKHWVTFGQPQEAREMHQAMELAQAELQSLRVQQLVERTETEMDIADLKEQVANLKKEIGEEKD